MHPFLTTYNQSTVPALKAQHSYTSSFAIPKVTKVSINVGVGDTQGNDKALEEIISLVTSITGQQPMKTKARKAISGFKIREGMIVGLKVTLRGARMYDFLSKLIQVALPRTRDFRGLIPTSITADGNLNIGIKDSMIFPEAAQLGTAHGIQITLVSTATSVEESRLLFESLGFVFQKEGEYVKKPARRGTHRRK